ncbi:hypothetical protein C0Z11_08440 [Acidipropionibacterium jensenii]|nr:hypothetical protein C0Z11_08440 [Acidipropionibacterium jensenii]
MTVATVVAPSAPLTGGRGRMSAIRCIGIGVGLWLVQRLAVVLTLLIGGGRLPDDLMRWDGQWYARVATNGYHLPTATGGGSHPWFSDLAFFPGLPAAARLLHLCGLSGTWATLIAGWAGFVLAAAVVTLVGRQVGGPRVGILLVLLWGVAPRAVVESLGYSEGWFIAAVGTGLLMGLRGHWGRAGLAVCVAGLIRPAVVPAVVLLGLVWVASWPVLGRGVPASQRQHRLLGAVLAPCGIVAYMALVAFRTGAWDGYFLVQRGWGSTLGWSNQVFRTAARMWPVAPYDWAYFGLVAASVVLYAVLLVAMFRTRQSPLLCGYVALILLLTVFSQGYFHSKARFMLPAFPAFLPVAQRLERMPLWITVLVMLVLTGLSTWWSISLLTGRYSP